MTALIALLATVLLAVVVLVVSAPLRARADSPGSEDPEHEDLEAARAAKYREIRDAELDYRTGKLSREDYEAVDGSLRSEAVEILDRLQTSEGRDGEHAPPNPDPRADAEPSGESGGANPQSQVEG
jgi:hypothetical protein